MKMTTLMSLLTIGLGCAADTEMDFDLPPVSVGKADGTHATITWNEARTRGTVSGSFNNNQTNPIVVGLSIPGAAGQTTVSISLSSGVPHLFVRTTEGSVLMQAHGEPGGLLSDFEHEVGVEYEMNLFVAGASSGTYTITVESLTTCATDWWEPNDTTRDAQQVTLSALFRGGICGEDVDFFEVVGHQIYNEPYYNSLRALLFDPTGGDSGLTLKVDRCSEEYTECEAVPRGDAISELNLEPIFTDTNLVIAATRNTDYEVSLCIEDMLETLHSDGDNDAPERASQLNRRQFPDEKLTLCSYAFRQSEEAGGRVVAEWRDIDYYQVEAAAFSVITVRLESLTLSAEDSRGYQERLQLVAPESARELEPGVWEFLTGSADPTFAVTNIDADDAVFNAYTTYTIEVTVDAGDD